MAKAQLDPPANADHQGLRAPLGHPVRPDQLARRVTLALQRQFASSLVRIVFAVEMRKSWLVLFARAVRPTERSARPLARQQPVYVYVGDLPHRVATFRTFSKSRMRWGNRSETRFADRGTRSKPHSCQAVPVSDTTSS